MKTIPARELLARLKTEGYITLEKGRLILPKIAGKETVYLSALVDLNEAQVKDSEERLDPLFPVRERFAALKAEGVSESALSALIAEMFAPTQEVKPSEQSGVLPGTGDDPFTEGDGNEDVGKDAAGDAVLSGGADPTGTLSDNGVENAPPPDAEEASSVGGASDTEGEHNDSDTDSQSPSGLTRVGRRKGGTL